MSAALIDHFEWAMLGAEEEHNLDPIAFIDEQLVAEPLITELIHRGEEDVVELVCQCAVSDAQFVQHPGVGRDDVSQTLVLSEKAGVGASPRPEECFDTELRYLLRVDVSLVLEDRIELWFGIMAVYSRNANARAEPDSRSAGERLRSPQVRRRSPAASFSPRTVTGS